MRAVHFSLIPHLSGESKDTLLQGRPTLEEYISCLKSTVGLGILVGAVGIGEEEDDLTTLVVEPGKNNKDLDRARPKIMISSGKLFGPAYPQESNQKLKAMFAPKIIWFFLSSLVHVGQPSDLREFKPVPVNSVDEVEVNVAGTHEEAKHTRKVPVIMKL
ncbi:hypothetical protein VNO80_29745 [Phaseolus coccineus]|uniref:Uncharacterized protein n=1 Tax=Phaseolus coccineus TaxID=3886 RepID=A0AAN9LBH5_PHACN